MILRNLYELFNPKAKAERLWMPIKKELCIIQEAISFNRPHANDVNDKRYSMSFDLLCVSRDLDQATSLLYLFNSEFHNKDGIYVEQTLEILDARIYIKTQTINHSRCRTNRLVRLKVSKSCVVFNKPSHGFDVSILDAIKAGEEALTDIDYMKASEIHNAIVICERAREFIDDVLDVKHECF